MLLNIIHLTALHIIRFCHLLSEIMPVRMILRTAICTPVYVETCAHNNTQHVNQFQNMRFGVLHVNFMTQIFLLIMSLLEMNKLLSYKNPTTYNDMYSPHAVHLCVFKSTQHTCDHAILWRLGLAKFITTVSTSE